jgi:5'-3' exoribonuclease 1
MGVLPDRSKKIVPKVYHELMTDPNSPIYDFYPRDFKLDMNGKKQEWEAVVKIPFIDEKRLLPAMATKDPLLSDAEKARNDFGVSLKFTYSNDMDYTYPSSLAGVFPDIQHCHCVLNIFDLPTIEGRKFHVGLMPGAKLGKSALAGFPSLKTLPFAGGLDFHGVNIFQRDSGNESMVVTLSDTEVSTKVEAAKLKIGKQVHVGYPFLQEAKIVRVSDELFDYVQSDNGDGQIIAIAHQGQDINDWRKKARNITQTYSKRLGMVIGDVESLVHVDMLKGLTRTDDGATVKEFLKQDGIAAEYASQTIVDEVISADQRFIERQAVPIEKDFPEGSKAFFLGEFNYGRPLEVITASGDKAEIWISTIKGRESEVFGKQIVAKAEQDTPWMPSYSVAKLLQLNNLVLSRLTSSFQVMDGGNRLNLGLNLKFEAKQLKVLGYSRKRGGGWEFSKKAIDLISQYMIKFPDFIAGIMKNPKADSYSPIDFYPEDIAKEKMKEIVNWLKSIEAKSFERVPLAAEQLDSDVVLMIEQAGDDMLKSGQQVEGKRIKGVPRKALLKPADAEHRLGNQAFTLGDRVVYAQDAGKVPIATRGTVVGLTQTSRTTLLDIVFDVAFMGGSTLGDRCSPFRGATVALTTVLNLTDRQLVAGSKASQKTQTSTPLTVNGYGAPILAGGRGQFVDARNPGPLQGSYRGAAVGQQNGYAGGRGRGGQPQVLPYREGQHVPQGQNGFDGGRGGRGGRGPWMDRGGRGGASRGRGEIQPVNGQDDGFTPVDNPNFRPRGNYQNMAPPASLDARGRGRGRGGARGPRGEGRGGRGTSRGRGASVAATPQAE